MQIVEIMRFCRPRFRHVPAKVVQSVTAGSTIGCSRALRFVGVVVRARGWSCPGARGRRGVCADVLRLTRTCGRRGCPRGGVAGVERVGSRSARGRWVRPFGLCYASLSSAEGPRTLQQTPNRRSRPRQRKARRRTSSRLHPHPQTRSARFTMRPRQNGVTMRAPATNARSATVKVARMDTFPALPV